jgi:hypothetical protein
MSEQKIAVKNVDDLIVAEEAIRMGRPLPDKKEIKDDEKGHIDPVSDDKTPKPSDDTEELPLAAEVPSDRDEQIEGKESKASPQIDEYGNKVGKKKMYSEEEVQNMIRERFNRGRWKEQEAPQIRKDAENFEPDSESEESWEVQLDKHIDKRIETRERRAQELDWKKREEETQAQFEVKFSQGMSKYDDFGDVVKGKPITNHMMMATRSFNDPASFIYAAAKLHAKELDRIANIPDTVAQIAEMGRLEERMRKAKATASSHKPVQKHAGDAASEVDARPNIDQLIISHAKSKLRR